MTARLPSALCAICDADACVRASWAVADLAEACLTGGARFLQVRGKQISSAALYETVLDIMRRVRGSGALIVVNDRADVGRLAAAGGVHVGQDDLPPAAVRLLLPAPAIVGLSTHTAAQVADAVQQPIDYVAIGPIFETRSKATGYDAVGLAAVRQTAAAAAPRGLPVVAIGGITIETAPAVIAAGASAVAVIGDLLSTGDPEARVRQYLRALA